jgi:hypothetical protein
MLRGNKELWWALFASALIGGIYALVMFITGNVPVASELFGHSLGILGFVLMMLTEVLYSLRKRSRFTTWGKMSGWLQFHIFTGLVGPFMVFLHTSWKFNGLAGVVTLMTLIVTLSGIIGRYIYTRIPRTVDGIEIEPPLGEAQATALANTRRLMALWHTIHIPLGMALFTVAFYHICAALYYATFSR